MTKSLLRTTPDVPKAVLAAVRKLLTEACKVLDGSSKERADIVALVIDNQGAETLFGHALGMVALEILGAETADDDDDDDDNDDTNDNEDDDDDEDEDEDD